MLNTTNNTNNITDEAIRTLIDIILDAMDTIVKEGDLEFRYTVLGGYSTLTRIVQGLVIQIFNVEDLNKKGKLAEPILEVPLILWTSISGDDEVLIKVPMTGFDEHPVDPDAWYIPRRGFVPAPGCRSEVRWYLEELQAYWDSEFGEDESGK